MRGRDPDELEGGGPPEEYYGDICDDLPEEDDDQPWYEPIDELEAVADAIFEECEDDVACIASRLDSLESELRWELLDSNLLNAWQVFYYVFRFVPDELVRERLELEPALAARTGVLLEERDLFEILFFVREKRGFIGVSDGETLLAHFEGRDAYTEAQAYVDENA
jgi:hypothetical protein